MRKVLDHKVLSLIALALICLVGYRFISSSASGGPGSSGGNRAIFVELGEAQFGTMREVGLYYGSLTAAQKFTVAARVGGQLKTLFADIGDQVENGQLLALMDDEEYRIARDHAAYNIGLVEAQQAEAEANLRLAQSDMNRQSSLADKRIVTQSDFEAAENKLQQAEARLRVTENQLRGAKSQLADADLRLSYTKINSTWPEDGPRFVAERMADEGALLTPNTPIFSIVSLDPLLVVVEVIEKDYPKIRIGQEAELRTEAWPGEIFKGRVLRVAPVLSATSRQARVELEVANPDLRLKPGMFSEVIFIFKEIQNVWSVPQDVPFRRRDGFVIFVADPANKTVEMRPVTLGLAENGMVELVDAAAIDGPVIFLGQHLLEDGMNYRLPEAPASPHQTGENDSADNMAKKPEQTQAENSGEKRS